MCCNISNMLLVLFAVVLILPAFQGEGFFPADLRCSLALLHSGNTYCKLSGHDKFESLIYKTCDLVCGGRKVKLPKKACPNGTMHNPCTEEERYHLQRWARDLENKKATIQAKWCNV
ncbi:uncharacterized protein LOC115315314 [Ixodes scapularis]|uniref:uncharacterized protein LOC115315314 n=1 Tax=Ixodes scapularis TaxID=6945 RepID=UPI001A9D3504|nr:uncharacterized protein LOC115315314 [Ixodes scapularis]